MSTYELTGPCAVRGTFRLTRDSQCGARGLHGTGRVFSWRCRRVPDTFQPNVLVYQPHERKAERKKKEKREGKKRKFLSSPKMML